ncbi:MAG: cytochrome o ubiquinol oxidase subunit IV [Halomonas sp.]|nr:cytochrome o ubiquinol oxidase subunit IV [Halomonas sp.]TVP48933.1 MAG: cytochrome o ubiquinol oxidase subunit IV [Halomonas sp.]
MSHPSSGAANAHGSVKSYVTGLVLSLILTIIPFAVVMSGALSVLTTVIVVAVTAVLQILVQLVMFMHMNTKADEGWNLMSFVFTLTILVLVVGGSLWIMQHLHLNMMIG